MTQNHQTHLHPPNNQPQDIYRTQIKQIYLQSKKKIEAIDLNFQNKPQPKDKAKNDNKLEVNQQKSIHIFSKHNDGQNPIKIMQTVSLTHENVNESLSTENVGQSRSNSKFMGLNSSEYEQRNNASLILRGESSKTMTFLRQEIQTKELKIRQLTNKCELLLQKLKSTMKHQDFEKQLQNIRESSDYKMQRLERLFKIKNEEIFYKMKLQIVSLLDQFGIAKQDLNEANQISNERDLFIFMMKKLKSKLRHFRSKEQESSFELQKDRLLNKKQEERIAYLNQTIQLMHISQNKFKAKIEDLKAQLNIFLEKLQEKQFQNQQLESQCFRLKKQTQELNIVNHKSLVKIQQVENSKKEEAQAWETKQTQLKLLLNTYYRKIQRLEGQNQASQLKIQEIMIRYKFLQQENESMNREYIRWKERYEWLQKEKENQSNQSFNSIKTLQADFQQYKHLYNEKITHHLQRKIEEIIKESEQYKAAYEGSQREIEDQKRYYEDLQAKHKEKVSSIEEEWKNRLASLQSIQQVEILELQDGHSIRERQIMQVFERKEELLIEEMEIRLNSLLKQKEKERNRSVTELQHQNSRLNAEIQNLKRFLKVKQQFVNAVRESSIKSQSSR